MAKSFLTPAGSTNANTAGNVVPFDNNEWIPTDVDGEVMQALQKASVIERVARRSEMTTDAEFKPRDHGTGIDSPRLVGFFPDVTGGDEVLLRPSVFGTQIAFERYDLDDTKPNPIPPKVQAWIRAAARAIDRMSLSTNPMTTRTGVSSSAPGGNWIAINSGSDSTAVKPETHVPACSVFATLAIGRSEDKILSPYASEATISQDANTKTPTDWHRPAGVGAVAEEYQFTPGITFGATRPIVDGRPVHCCTLEHMVSSGSGTKGSRGYDLFSATKAILEDGYFYAEGEMIWVVPYAFKDTLRRIKDEQGQPLLATAVEGEFDRIFGDPVLYTPGGKLSRLATVIDAPKANIEYGAATADGAPTVSGASADHAFNRVANGGYLSPTVYASAAAATTALPAPGQTVGQFLLYGHPMHLINGLRSGPEYMASRFNAESKFNKDWLKMQMRRGFSVGFPNAMAALVVVPGARVGGGGSAVGDPVNPVTGLAHTRTS